MACIGLHRVVQALDRWQELPGAIIGGGLGVIGALIGAREALNRERRNASRMLQHDLLGITDAVSCLTYRRGVTLETASSARTVPPCISATSRTIARPC